MSNRKNLMAYFNNESKFNEEEERLRTSLKENTFDCLDLDINHQFPDGTLPIHYACLYNPEIYLSNKNNLPDSLINTSGGPYKCTPMMFTIYNSNYKILLHLLLRGANILIRNSRSSDVLSFCVRYDDLLGLILVLSFLKENISVKRYLRYSWKKDSERTRDFLLKRELEIEGKGINQKSKDPIFTEDNIGCVLSFIFMILCMVFIQSSRLIFSCLFLVFYIISESPIISFIFNIAFNFYSYCLIFNSLSKESGYFIAIGMHLINFLFIQIIKTPYLNIRKIKDSKSFITDMIHADAYNEENFCVTCLNSNIFLDKHCDFCNRCVSNYIYHCPLLNKCITTKNYALFVLYCFTSLIIYILTLCSSFMHTPLYEFIICLFLVIGSLRMFKESNKVSKKQNKKETIPNSDIIPPPSYVSIPIDKI